MEQRLFIINIVRQIKDYLSNRPKGKRIDDFLEIVFEKYNKLVNDNCIADCLSDLQLSDIKKIEHNILQSLRDYFNGALSGALAEIQELLFILKRIQEGDAYILKAGEIWYRGRIKDEGYNLYTKKEMFHIPEHLREKVNSQRFSFNGYPCLYLGKTIWACWEELDEPHLDDVCFSAFKLKKDIRLLDLSIPTKETIMKLSVDNFSQLLVSLPVIIACSIKTANDKANFKSEYVIPQLMMAELINGRGFDGYVFSSTKKNPAFEWKEDYLLNVVLPVAGNFDDDGLCISLKQEFLLTEPIYYKYEFLKGNVSNLIMGENEDIDGIFDKSLQINNEDLYPKALFGQLEELLVKKKFSPI